MRHTSRRRLAAAAAGSVIAALVLSGCVASERGKKGGDEKDNTFIFAASSDPASLDPAFAQDGESFRVSRQIFEGLVGVKPGTADPAPLLAEKWESSADGMTHTFHLKKGVKFHDGTDFNADAVCFNFDRWFNWKGIAQTATFSYYYGKLFHGFADSPDNAVYKSCEAKGKDEAVVTLNQPFAGFIPSLSLPAFAMQSPEALKKYDADAVGGSEDSPQLAEYAKKHPTGTGPYEFVSWKPGENITLKENPNYWGKKGQIKKIIFRVIDNPTARRQALESGSIDGYDLVGPADTKALKDKGYHMESRPPFTILYLGFDMKTPELQDVKVRQAISYAVNKQQLVKQVLPEGTEVATQFMPPVVNGYNKKVTTYDHDVEKAKQLLAEAGYNESNPLTLDFNYPVNVSRPYMPDPEQIFTVLSKQLEEAGIKVKPVTAEWTDYIDKVGNGSSGLRLLGWTGDYNDSDNFVGVFFGTESKEWGFNNPELFGKLAKARGVAKLKDQTPLYEEINEDIAKFIPGVPLAHPSPTLAFSKRVKSYPASPVNDEVFSDIVLEK